MTTFEEMLRDFNGLVPTDFASEFDTPNNDGWVERWYCRLVYEEPRDSTFPELMDKWSRTPIIEFYSLDTNQFISSYYVDTFLGLDEHGNGYGSPIWLWADVPSWRIGAEDADIIRDWCVEALRELDGDYPFQIPW